MSEKGREAHPEVREDSVGQPGGIGEVGRPSRRFGMGREANTEVQVWSGGPPGGP